ncbi:hypothetical protein [Streptomyces sp. PTD5-9]|uniref:hypothetical protein n=1 Tax=Streptomyces sp. PTD5-9 TaxID=3120150 RepID=UPI0030086183
MTGFRRRDRPSAAEDVDAAARARETFGRVDAGPAPAGAVHGEIFRALRPVTTTAEAGALAAADLPVAMNADAVPR